MTPRELKKGVRVYDRWWPHWGTGVVIKRMNTRAVVRFPERDLTYDRAHLQFLSPAS